MLRIELVWDLNATIPVPCASDIQVSAKKLARRLQALGGQPFHDTGLGDDQHPSGYEAALDIWVTTMWEAARKLAGPLPADIAQVCFCV